MSQELMAEESESEVSEERREYRRVEVEFPVWVHAPVRIEGQAQELSEGGLRVELLEDLSHAMHVSIEFRLPGRETPLGMLADIRWHKQMGSKAEPRWIYGLRFTELEADKRSLIERFIDEQTGSDQ